MKQKRTFILLIFTSLALLLSACGGRAYGTSGWSGITTTKDTIYMAETNYVYGINAADGVEKWRYPQKAESTKTFYSAPVLTDDGQLLAASYDHHIYSLDPNTGQAHTGGNWPFTAENRFLASPLVYKGTIYAPNSDGKLYAMDQTGKLLWSFPDKNNLGALWATPAIDDKSGYIFLPSMDHFLYAIDSKSGNQVWKADLGASIAGTPAIMDGKVYEGNFESKLFAFDIQNGKPAWSNPVDLKKGWVWAGPAASNGRLYFGDTDGNFYILSAADGSVIKQSQPAGSIVNTPALTKDAVYFGSDNGSIYAVDQDGNPLWNQTVGGNIYTSPGLVYDGNNNLQLILAAPVDFKDAILVAFAPDKTQKWTFNPKK